MPPDKCEKSEEDTVRILGDGRSQICRNGVWIDVVEPGDLGPLADEVFDPDRESGDEEPQHDEPGVNG